VVEQVDVADDQEERALGGQVHERLPDLDGQRRDGPVGAVEVARERAEGQFGGPDGRSDRHDRRARGLALGAEAIGQVALADAGRTRQEQPATGIQGARQFAWHRPSCPLMPLHRGE
jgi:hypothetical protein